MKFKELNKVNAEANSQRIVVKRGINWNYIIYYACVVDPLFKSMPKIAWPKSRSTQPSPKIFILQHVVITDT